MLAQWEHGTLKCKNLKVFIDKIAPEWADDFPKITQRYRFQQFSDVVKLRRIWANI